MKRLIGLLFLSTFVFATPTAEEARRQSSNVRSATILRDIVLLSGKIDAGIAEQTKYGYYSYVPNVTDYSEESIHIVNQRLRKLGYKCDVLWIHFTHEEVDSISWER